MRSLAYCKYVKGGPDGRRVCFFFRNVTEHVLFGARGSMPALNAGKRQANIIATR